MKLKNKLARRLRKWADKLDPTFLPNLPGSNVLHNFSSRNINDIRVKKTYSASLLDHYPDYYEKVKREMAYDLAKTLIANSSVTINKNVRGNMVEYLGTLKIIMPND